MRPAGALLLGLLLASSARGQGFQRTVVSGTGDHPVCLTWSDRGFVYHPDQAGSARTPGDAGFAAIDRAFATWQALSDGCSDFRFDAGVRLAQPLVGPGSAGGNVLTFREVACADVVPPADPCLALDSCGNPHRCWGHAAAVIALTTLTYDAHTGVALDGDVELNAAGFLFTTVDAPACPASAPAPTCVATDLQNTLTHEIGHLVGLAHVTIAGSTMAPDAAPGETSKRRLDPGTAAGFCQIYPRGKPPTPCDPSAQASGQVQASGAGCGCGGAVAGVLAPAALLLAAVRRGPRRRPGMTRW